MADLVVLGFDSEETAGEVAQVTERLVAERLLSPEDYVTVVRGMDGRARINQAFNTTAAGALGGAFWGVLIGFLTSLSYDDEEQLAQALAGGA